VQEVADGVGTRSGNQARQAPDHDLRGLDGVLPEDVKPSTLHFIEAGTVRERPFGIAWPPGWARGSEIVSAARGAAKPFARHLHSLTGCPPLNFSGVVTVDGDRRRSSHLPRVHGSDCALASHRRERLRV
jgi:hypothetical protein